MTEPTRRPRAGGHARHQRYQRDVLTPCGQRVAAVGEAVHDEVAAPQRARRARSAPAGARARSARRRRRRARAGARARRRRTRAQRRGFCASVPSRDGVVDARQVLAHDRARAEVQVTDLGVAHLPLGQPDGAPAGGQRACAGRLAHSSSKTGVRASETALPGPGLGARPQPSSTTRQAHGTGRRRRGPAGERSSPASVAARRCQPRSRRTDVGLQRGAADERAVDVGQRQQLGGVLGLDRAAVEDRARARRPAPARSATSARMKRDRLLRLLGASRRGRCRSPRSARRRSPPRPSALVGDAAEVLAGPGGAACARCRRRRAPPRSRPRTGSAQPRLQRRRHLQRERAVGLAEQRAPLGVAEHDAARRRARRASARRSRR